MKPIVKTAQVGALPTKNNSKFKMALTKISLATLFGSLALPASAALLEEVVVTAQKREQNLQDVSVSVSAFTGDIAEKLGFSQALDIAAYVPNMAVWTSFGEAMQPSFSLRGLSMFKFTDEFESPVAFYVDEIYKGQTAGHAIQMFDIERLEVLRGPQGTLFGRNATGGLIHVISRKPTEELDARISAQFSRWDQVLLEGGIGGPLSDNVRGRIAFRSNKQDGWADGFLDGLEYNQVDSTSVRGLLDIDLSENITMQLNVTHSNADNVGAGFGLVGYLDPATGEMCATSRIRRGECGSIRLDNNNNNDLITANQLGGLNPENVPGTPSLKPVNELETLTTSLRLDWDLGSDYVLTLIAARDEVEKYYLEDLDSALAFEDGFSVDSEQLTFEARLARETDRLSWVGGLFYYDDDKDVSFFIPDVTVPGDPIIYSNTSNVTTEALALFGQADISLTDELTLIVGARYSTDDREVSINTFDPLGFSANGGSYSTKVSADTDKFTWKLGLDWQLLEDTLLYASASTGYNGAAAPAVATFEAPENIRAAKEEFVTTYEIGLKTELWDGRARVNAALFWTDYEDVQVSIAEEAAGQVANVLTSIGDAEIYGAELEVTLIPTENLDFIFAAGYLENEIESDIGVEIAGGEESMLDGNDMPFTPELTLSLLGRYTIDLEERGSLALQVDWSYQDDAFFTVDNTDTSQQEAYDLWGARVSWMSPEDKYSVEFFVENLTDEEYTQTWEDLPDDFGFVVWGKPRWYGIKFSYRH